MDLARRGNRAPRPGAPGTVVTHFMSMRADTLKQLVGETDRNWQLECAMTALVLMLITLVLLYYMFKLGMFILYAGAVLLVSWIIAWLFRSIRASLAARRAERELEAWVPEGRSEEDDLLEQELRNGDRKISATNPRFHVPYGPVELFESPERPAAPAYGIVAYAPSKIALDRDGGKAVYVELKHDDPVHQAWGRWRATVKRVRSVTTEAEQAEIDQLPLFAPDVVDKETDRLDVRWTLVAVMKALGPEGVEAD